MNTVTNITTELLQATVHGAQSIESVPASLPLSAVPDSLPAVRVVPIGSEVYDYDRGNVSGEVEVRIYRHQGDLFRIDPSAYHNPRRSDPGHVLAKYQKHPSGQVLRLDQQQSRCIDLGDGTEILVLRWRLRMVTLPIPVLYRDTATEVVWRNACYAVCARASRVLNPESRGAPGSRFSSLHTEEEGPDENGVITRTLEFTVRVSPHSGRTLQDAEYAALRAIDEQADRYAMKLGRITSTKVLRIENRYSSIAVRCRLTIVAQVPPA